MNQTSQEILEEYKVKFRDLEDSYYELSGHYPAWDEWDFWGGSKVAQIDSLLQIWWDLSEILATNRRGK